MCKAFSCIVTRSSQVAWRMGLDSHDQIFQAFNDGMPELKDDGEMTRFVKIEIIPDNDNYFDAESPWFLRIDEDEIPDWYTSQHEAAAMQAMREWRNQLYAIVDLNELQHLVNPFVCKPHPIDDEVLELVNEWKKDTVGDTVWDAVGDTVWDAVWATVLDTVGDTVWAYFGSLFSSAWKNEYPYSSSVKLWKMGLVIYSDSKNWYLVSKNGIEYTQSIA